MSFTNSSTHNSYSNQIYYYSQHFSKISSSCNFKIPAKQEGYFELKFIIFNRVRDKVYSMDIMIQ